MKHLIRALLLVAIALAVFLGTWAVLQRYENHKIDREIEATQAKAADQNARLDAEQASQAELTRLKASHELVRQECLKGLAGYDLLTPANKTRVSQPDCGQPL